MAIKGYSFESNYATSPGSTLKEVLEDRKMTQADLSDRIGLTPQTLSKIIRGSAPITPETATNLEVVLGVPASFWNNLEVNYRTNQEAKRKEIEYEKQINFIKNVPYNEMAKVGLVKKTRNPGEKIDSLLRFFGCASVEILQRRMQDDEVLSGAYRGTTVAQVDKLALMAWVRKGELEAQKIKTDVFSKEKAIKSIGSIRKLTNEADPDVFIPELQKICATFGVALVLVPEVKGSRVSGLTRWLTPHPKAIIQLSLRYKTNDNLWFTFFHELCHVIRHKKEPFLTFNKDYADSPVEKEANVFAANTLIPKYMYDDFLERGLFNQSSVTIFANQINIHPGIVVGRLQKDGKLGWSQLQHLKVRYEWPE